jgi:hypothetical protein
MLGLCEALTSARTQPLGTVISEPHPGGETIALFSPPRRFDEKNYRFAGHSAGWVHGGNQS